MVSPVSSSMTSRRRWRRWSAWAVCAVATAAGRSRSGSPPRGWQASTWRCTRASRRTDERMAERRRRDSVIRVEDDFYIRATSERVDDRTRVLKQGDTFAVFDRRGDMHALGLGEFGLYHGGTRFLSQFELQLTETPPLLLSSM